MSDNTFNEGPTWIAGQKAFFFSNFLQGQAMHGDIVKYTPGGACEVSSPRWAATVWRSLPMATFLAACGINPEA